MAAASTALAASTSTLRQAPSAPASSFGAMFRRSRFASYDPAIRQVYASPPADAHRGNWGFKRALPIRRRNAFVTVPAVDTNVQQTEFNRAETQARFMRRWAELAITPRVAVDGSWHRQLGAGRTEWVMDSEFVHADEAKARPRSVVPNIHAMPHAKFVRYLRKVRALRPAFKEFVHDAQIQEAQLAAKKVAAAAEARAAAAADYDSPGSPNSFTVPPPLPEPKPLLDVGLDVSGTGNRYHRKFIADKYAATQLAYDSRRIEQQPHRFGGLTYTPLPPLQTFLITRPQPGLLLQPAGSGDPNAKPANGAYERQDEMWLASFAGLTPRMRKGEIAPGVRGVLGQSSEYRVQDAALSVMPMRMRSEPGLVYPPTVVGQKGEGLKGAKFHTEVVNGAPRFEVENSFTPGSPAYIVAEEGGDGRERAARYAHTMPVVSRAAGKKTSRPAPSTGSAWTRPPLAAAATQKTGYNDVVLDTLKGILHRNKDNGNGNGNGNGQ